MQHNKKWKFQIIVNFFFFFFEFYKRAFSIFNFKRAISSAPSRRYTYEKGELYEKKNRWKEEGTASGLHVGARRETSLWNAWPADLEFYSYTASAACARVYYIPLGLGCRALQHTLHTHTHTHNICIYSKHIPARALYVRARTARSSIPGAESRPEPSIDSSAAAASLALNIRRCAWVLLVLSLYIYTHIDVHSVARVCILHVCKHYTSSELDSIPLAALLNSRNPSRVWLYIFNSELETRS